ncbi:MOSC domain-containing protein [Actibacterium pelagium]|uniref:Molybdenum cofactor sulfurase n=1 Tax=Actibacterium pelagium TaxID=2029103 RepID=A0A917AFN0_9RHOB|nr:MOSC domain-containing protein [Actibacterium pelagium]GGE50035.1 molybdenum cofactor sulfurase [Actibacterium pelagium]
MSALQGLTKGYAKPGRVTWIGLRPERRADVAPVSEVFVGEDGLQGDHGRPGKRAVTLVQAEHLGAIGSYLGQGAVDPKILRRNIVVEGINLVGLKRRVFRVGEAELELAVICAPCSRMEEAFGKGGYSAVRGHGGWCASVVTPGRVAVGEEVVPIG